MLVKFISFAITLFGTKRYKPWLLSGLAGLLVVIGVTTVLSLNKTPDHTAASTSQATEQGTTQALSSQGLAKQKPQEQPAVPDQTQATPTEADATTPTTPATTPTKPTVAPGITTTPADTQLTLKPGATSSTITATSNDNSSLVWSFETPPGVTGITVNSVQDKTVAAPSFSFTISADTSLDKKLYTVIIHGKDSGLGTEVPPKKITINVTSSTE